MTTTIIAGDCRTILPTLETGSVQCCVTSPPYFGLRDYGTAQWDGGDPTCDHRHDTAHQKQGATSQRAGRANAEAQRNESFRATCGKCGAVRIDRQIGLESSVDAYVAELVAVFAEVRRVLRDDGTLWLNLGDSYAGSNKGAAKRRNDGQKESYVPRPDSPQCRMPKVPVGLKPKDLIGIPWRVAFALQADGWRLRSDIIWHKPNPMPESVTDRPTRSHEYLFLLAKSARYDYDAEAIAESSIHAGKTITLGEKSLSRGQQNGIGAGHWGNGSVDRVTVTPTRNRRSVWTISTKPYKGAHFATFPPDLIEPCIKAGSRPGDVVLDPFGGSGTTGLVAERLGRDAILIELNPAYADMAHNRIVADAPLLTEVNRR